MSAAVFALRRGRAPGAIVGAVVIAGMLLGALLVFAPGLFGSVGTYPTTQQGWAQRWKDAASEYGRVAGEGWDVFLDVRTELAATDDTDRVAAAADRLRAVERFTAEVPDVVGTAKAFEQMSNDLSGLRKPVVIVMVPAMQAAIEASDLHAAAEWVERAWALARVAEGAGTISGAMLQNAVVSTVFDAMRAHAPIIATDRRLSGLAENAPVADIIWSLRLDREDKLGTVADLRIDSWMMASDELELLDRAYLDWIAYETTGDTAARDRVVALRDRLDNDRAYARRRPVLDGFFFSFERASLFFRAIHAERDALRVMLALERWRAANGRYPDTLDVLVPGQLAALPPDRGAGVLRYRLVDAASADPLAAYVLYADGLDGVDNDGTENSERPGTTLTDPNRTGDHVFNRPAPLWPAAGDEGQP